LGQGRGEEPNTPFQKIDKHAVLEVLKDEHAHEAVTWLQLFISLFQFTVRSDDHKAELL
jgi:hypothetical protein